jgi:hypothetical protein
LVPRTSALLLAAIAGSFVLQPSRAHAQWWSRAPADFEECADKAEKAATKQAKASAFSECNAKFAGRRKPGGGYTYFDFMQNRSFDIAGPNPTPEEQRRIDQQYTAYLDHERRSRIAAAVTAQQLQQASLRDEKQLQLQQASLRDERASRDEKPSVPPRSSDKPRPAPGEARRATPREAHPHHTQAPNCTQHSFSCEWPRLSEGIDNLKKALFGPPAGKPKRS